LPCSDVKAFLIFFTFIRVYPISNKRVCKISYVILTVWEKMDVGSVSHFAGFIRFLDPKLFKLLQIMGAETDADKD
jgi:hypothetical protein